VKNAVVEGRRRRRSKKGRRRMKNWLIQIMALKSVRSTLSIVTYRKEWEKEKDEAGGKQLKIFLGFTCMKEKKEKV
jgi:hypothetical protein